ncbi:MAG: FeoB-associated Cys-rich membrane protein [Clostridia bacterium]|nr:FeoB-associated Cys-rich membrane protein [Clostridia bacterium]
MLAWLQQNWGNVVILGVIALIVGAILFSYVRKKRQGKSTCLCGCSQCAMQGICHQQKKGNENTKDK